MELGKSLKRVVCGPFCRLRPICPIDDDIDWKWKASKMKQKEKNDKALKYETDSGFAGGASTIARCF